MLLSNVRALCRSRKCVDVGVGGFGATDLAS